MTRRVWDHGELVLKRLRYCRCVSVFESLKADVQGSNMTKIGFVKQTDVIDGVRYSVYSKGFATVLQNQTRKNLQSGIIGQVVSKKCLTNQMNVNTENLACKGTEPHNQTSRKLDVCQRLPVLHSEKFLVEAPQLKKRKLYTTLGEHTFLLYPLQVTHLTFTDKLRRAHLTRGDTIVHYLLVQKDTQTRRLGHVSAESEKRTKATRLFSLHVLHTCIGKTMEALAEVACRSCSMRFST